MPNEEERASEARTDPPARASLTELDLFDAAPDGVVLVDEDGRILRLNERARDLFGYEPGELTGEPIETLIPERFRAHHVDNRKAYTARPSRRPMGATLALFGRRKNGEEFAVDVSLNTSRDEHGRRVVIAFVRDVTERRHMEEELRASELLVENVADHAIFMLDPAGRIVTWNTGAERIKGWAAEDVIGRHFSVFYLPEEIASGQPERDLERAATDGRAHGEGWRVRAGGQRFWAETTIAVVRNDDGTLRGFAKVTRDRTENRQTRARLEGVAELNRAVLDGRPEEEVIALIVARARAMVGATLAVAWGPDASASSLVAVHAVGDGAAMLAGTSVPRDSLITLVMQSSRPEHVRDLASDRRAPKALVDAGMGSGLFVPVHAAGDTFAVLGVLLGRNRDPMEPHEIDLLQAFATHTGVAIAHGRARRDTEQLQIVTERERIARDLHDSVIQRLFAVGLALEATGRRPPDETRDRLHRAVTDIDDTIRAIRSSIFTLERRTDDAPTLRRRVLDVVAEEAPALGFEPSVAFEGPVDTLSNGELTDNLVATLREALSNVGRHAQATRVSVTVEAGDDIVLVVEDDGVGAASFARQGGHGVTNIRNRAQLLGGDATIGEHSPHGTRVEWRVPAAD